MYTDQELIRRAYSLANLSPDPSSQNGAVLVGGASKVILGEGLNCFPRGVQYTDERWERPGKYQWIEHAERNALYDAAVRGRCTKGSVLYCPWFACADCARAIIQCGVVEVVGHKVPGALAEHERWAESIGNALTMLEEAGVKTRYVEDLFGMTVLRDSVLIEV